MNYNSMITKRGIFYLAMIHLFLLSLFVSSCRKEKAVPPEEMICGCEPIPLPQGWTTGYDYVYESTYYELPYFNPNNDNELIYMERNAGEESELVKYNMQTNERVVIYTGNIYSYPVWGVNDWILLSMPDENIWKIKSNGDSLTQLTFDGGNFHPEWNLNASKFITYSFDNNFSSYVYSPEGDRIDTIPFVTYATGTWQHPHYYAKHKDGKITIYDIEEESLISEFTSSEKVSYEGRPVWLDEDRLMWSNVDGIFTSDLTFSNVQHVLSSSDSRLYLAGTINKSKTKVVWKFVERDLLDENTLKIKSNLVIMNTDGTNIQKLELP